MGLSLMVTVLPSAGGQLCKGAARSLPWYMLDVTSLPPPAEKLLTLESLRDMRMLLAGGDGSGRCFGTLLEKIYGSESL